MVPVVARARRCALERGVGGTSRCASREDFNRDPDFDSRRDRRVVVVSVVVFRLFSTVGRPGAVDGGGYIPSSALELQPPAAATVADAAAVLATAPARLTRATASRKHDRISRRTAVTPAAAVASAAASDVGRSSAVDGEDYIPSSALELPPTRRQQWPTQQPCSRRRRCAWRVPPPAASTTRARSRTITRQLGLSACGRWRSRFL